MAAYCFGMIGASTEGMVRINIMTAVTLRVMLQMEVQDIVLKLMEMGILASGP